jgi:hypothetical protein
MGTMVPFGARVPCVRITVYLNCRIPSCPYMCTVFGTMVLLQYVVLRTRVRTRVRTLPGTTRTLVHVYQSWYHWCHTIGTHIPFGVAILACQAVRTRVWYGTYSQDDHPWNPQARTTTETVLREAMQALVRVQAHMLARIVVEIRAADIAVELEPLYTVMSSMLTPPTTFPEHCISSRF